MSLDQLYQRLLAAQAEDTPDPDQELPSTLARVCRQLAHATGASIDLWVGHVRLAVGASDDEARLAQALERIAGDGPHLHSRNDTAVIDAPASSMRRRWPLLQQLRVDRTDYRAAVALPLSMDSDLAGVLNLYFDDEREDLRFDLVTAAHLSVLVARSLENWALDLTPSGHRDPAGSPIAARDCVWMAVGMLSYAGRTGAGSALAVLRRWSHDHGHAVHDTAECVVSGELDVRQLLELDLSTGPTSDHV